MSKSRVKSSLSHTQKWRAGGSLYRRTRGIIVGIMIVATINMLTTQLLYTPKLYLLLEERNELFLKYDILSQRVTVAQSSVDDMWQRDKELYRAPFGIDSMHVDNIYNPYPDLRYSFLHKNVMEDMVKRAWGDMDFLAKGIYRNSLSFDQVNSFINDRDVMSTSVPAIWPIDRDKLRSNIGAFGNRLHPIYKRYIMHKGVDLSCSLGDPIYATADGVIEKVDRGLRSRGYGQMIIVDHKFGYKTRYAHMSRMLVEIGDSVKRGDIIGEAGSTGGSTGVHLHYEVIYNGNVVNPINYFDRYMTNEQYTEIAKRLVDTNFEIVE